MTHNSLDWKIFEVDGTFSVYHDSPAEGFWFRSRAEAELFRLTLANENIDPMTAYAHWTPAK